MDFPLKFSGLHYSDSDEGSQLDIPAMPVSERTLRRWLANDLLSGWALLSGAVWGFASGIVEHAWELKRQLAAREPPRPPPILSGKISVAQLHQQVPGISSSKLYAIIEGHAAELGAEKSEGRWQIADTCTSDAIITIMQRLA